jgi:hypothetical protein
MTISSECHAVDYLVLPQDPTEAYRANRVRSVFVATGGYLGRIDGPTRCAFWSEDPCNHGFDPSLLISIDLALTPRAAAEGEISWDAVQVDDCISGPNGMLGGTTLGVSWPELQIAGAVYLQEEFWRTLPDHIRPPRPPHGMTGYAHEYTTVVYWPHTDDPRAGNRYSGHHARIVEVRGDLARLAVYPPGSGMSIHAHPLTMWIDLSSPEACDAGTATLTTISIHGPHEGAVFLISGTL